MLASIVSNYKNKFVFIIIVCLLGSFLLLNSKVASAQTPPSDSSTNMAELQVAELQAMINNLIAQIAYLQSLRHQPTPTPDRVLFEVGMEIETTANLNVRSAPSITAPFLGLQRKGSQGVIVQGPAVADNYYWYKVHYDNGVAGWNVAGWLKNKVNIVDRNTICPADVMICPDGRSVGRSGPSCQFICPAPGSYSLSDVSYVTLSTTRSRDLDGGVYTYTIVLKNDKSYQVTVYDREQFASREAKFRATGYTGDVKKLMAMAIAVETKPTPRFESITPLANSNKVTVSAVFAAATTRGISPLDNSAVTGPVIIGYINWGDAKKDERVSALANKDQITVNLKHTYANAGTYTIKLIGLDGKTVSKEVKVTFERKIICPTYMKLCPDGNLVSGGPSCQFICPAPGSYSLADVKSVTVEKVDPIPTAVDDEYTLYRIVLNNGKVHEVKVGFMTISDRDAQFRKTGYTGDIAKLMAMATAVETKPTPRFESITPLANSNKVTVSAVFAAATTRGISPLDNSAVTGPVIIGYINWGDAKKDERVSALANKDQITVNLKHTYKNPGTYTIKLTGLDGKTVSKKVVVKPITPIAGVPVCNSITANPKVIVSGATSTLTWITTNATKATIRQANLNQALQVSPNRSMLVNPNKTSRFILTLTNAKGVSHCEATVQVNSGAVLGASTDIYDEIGNILLKISSLLDELKN